VRNKSVWERACGLSRTVVEAVEFDERANAIIVSVRPVARARGRCGMCGRRSPGYDLGDGRRRWRALDLGTTKVFLEAAAPRVRRRTHGVTVAAVPWARHGAGHTRDFDDLAAWLAVRTSKSAVMELLRVAWRTVGSIVTRVNADIDATIDRLDGLRRIGIDEISYRKGQRYLLVVTCHDTGRLVWAGKDRTKATLGRFFDDLGAERAAALTHVSADGAEFIHTVVAERAPGAVLCLDPFHVVAWATKALDEVRRGLAAELRRGGRAEEASTIKGTRWALLRNPGSLSVDQRTTLAGIQATNGPLYRAYLLKEQLRAVFQARDLADATRLLVGWLAWAARCRLPAFVKLAKTIKKYRQLILNAVEHGLSNARSEATNTHLRLLTRRSYGLSPESLMAMAGLTRGGLCPPLPGRS
jgi:transposase